MRVRWVGLPPEPPTLYIMDPETARMVSLPTQPGQIVVIPRRARVEWIPPAPPPIPRPEVMW